MFNSYLTYNQNAIRLVPYDASNIHIKSSNMNTSTKVQEIFNDIPNYEGYYQVSNFGNVKSLPRIIEHSISGYQTLRERILKLSVSGTGYLSVSLCKNGISETYLVHQLVAITFLNHKPNGFKLVCNHKNFNILDNRVENLEIVTNRENSNQKHIKHSSKYTGVTWRKDHKKWCSQIRISGKKMHLGYFTNEYDASLAYEKAIKHV